MKTGKRKMGDMWKKTEERWKKNGTSKLKDKKKFRSGKKWKGAIFQSIIPEGEVEKFGFQTDI